VCCFVEVAAIANERMEVRFDPTGRATILAGTFSHGQGHETVFTQMVSDWLGLPFGEIGFVNGDTDQVSHGGGTYASRSITVGGSALRSACDGIITKAGKIAAWMLEVDAHDIAFDDGIFSAAGSNETVTLSDAATAAYRPMGFPVELGVGLEAVGYFAATPQNYPNGCHIAEVEIDPDFGTVQVDRYCAVDDIGAVANPLLLEGQLHGSVAQGLGPALFERIVYDEHGQLITAAFTEYGMPRAHHVPEIESDLHLVPTTSNPLGVKGGAEMGTIAAPPAIAQAVEDALDYPNRGELEFPATPNVVLAAHRSDARPAA
jgi:carbon-monoxide dehydrogenase large subunit